MATNVTFHDGTTQNWGFHMGCERVANWLQNRVDRYRNRILIHQEGCERDGFHMKGIKSQGKENARSFIRPHRRKRSGQGSRQS